MPSINKNHNFIFSVVDAFTKHMVVSNQTTSNKKRISKLKIQQATFSNLDRIGGDRGVVFTSNEFKKYVEEENNEHALTITAIPIGNEQLE